MKIRSSKRQKWVQFAENVTGRQKVCVKTKPRMCKYLADGSLGACSNDMVCSEYESAYRLGNLTIKEKLLIHIVVFAIVGAIIWNYNSKLVK